MEFQEFTGDNVDLAINEALTKLQVPSYELEYEVVRKESAGFLGFGKKPAIIRARVKEVVIEEQPKEEKKQQPKKPQAKKPEAKPVVKEQKPAKEDPVTEKKAVEKSVETEKAAAPDVKKEFKKNKNKKKNRDNKPKASFDEAREVKREQPKREPKPEPVVVERSDEEITVIKKAANDFLTEVFKAMEIPAELTIEYAKDTGNLEIDIAGDDMGVLIGKRGQTLDSLQYLTSLVVNKSENSYVRVKLDTENYRSRRKDTLENLARNIAYKVKKTRRPVSLEPMNPYERRIIHSSLQSNKFVETYSEGNEPYRHVVVVLKKGGYYQKDNRKENE